MLEKFCSIKYQVYWIALRLCRFTRPNSAPTLPGLRNSHVKVPEDCFIPFLSRPANQQVLTAYVSPADRRCSGHRCSVNTALRYNLEIPSGLARVGVRSSICVVWHSNDLSQKYNVQTLGECELRTSCRFVACRFVATVPYAKA